VKIFAMADGKVQALPSLYQALRLDAATKTIAFVGGGGKTTLIYALAEELQRRGKRVVVTTTTHMQRPKYFFVAEKLDAACRAQLGKKAILVAGQPCGNGKLSAVTAAFFAVLAESADYLLVEADGAKRLPLKVPDLHEPVLPEHADLVVGVAGIDALGKSIGEICHRAQRTADFLGKSLDDFVEEEDFAAIFQSNQGSRKQVQCRFQAVIHKVDTVSALDRAARIARLMKETVIATGREL